MPTMKNLFVIKYGGAAMSDASTARDLAAEIAQLARCGSRIVLVHGGGPEIDRALRRAGIEPKKIDGLRVTDDETMNVVEMVLAGRVNKALAAQLCQAGVRAVGLSGRDANLLLAQKRLQQSHDLGRVGSVIKVESGILSDLLSAGYLPVVCSVAADSVGGALNVNADEVAAAIAVALRASSMVLLTDVPGVLRSYPDESTLISRLTIAEAETLLRSGAIAKGMIPKITSSIEVVRAGVGEVRIMDGRSPHYIRQALEGGAFGTAIVP